MKRNLKICSLIKKDRVVQKNRFTASISALKDICRVAYIKCKDHGMKI